MAFKKHYTIDNDYKQVKAIVADITEREKKEIKNYIDLGYTLIPQDRPKKKKQTEEEKKANPFSQKNIQNYLENNATKEQQKQYWNIYNEQAIDKKTQQPAVYKTDSKEEKDKAGNIIYEKGQKFKKGDPKPKGHIATLQWFKIEFPDYPEK